MIDAIGKVPDQMITGNGPRLHGYIREMSRETFQKYGVMTVGETWGAAVDSAKLHSNPDGAEFSMVFHFQHICSSWTRECGKWRQEKKDLKSAW